MCVASVGKGTHNRYRLPNKSARYPLTAMSAPIWPNGKDHANGPGIFVSSSFWRESEPYGAVPVAAAVGSEGRLSADVLFPGCEKSEAG